MIKAVIFDCDGVLVDSEVLAQQVELQALAEIGLEYDPESFSTRFLGMSNDSFFAALERDSVVHRGCALPAGFRARCQARYHGLLDEQLAEVPGAREAVASIRHPKAVASSSERPALEKKLRKTGLWAHFAPHIYSADHVAAAKPAPDLFLHAAEALARRPEDCLVLEDSGNGVTAARAAGMRVWGFLGGGHHLGPGCGARLKAAGAERLVGNWQDATQLLAEILGEP
jgi:HAD superfamily hydrolase (TIGR01509 family)